MALVRRSRSHRRNSEKTQAEPERFCLRITAPLLALGCVLLILTLGWAFFTGFLVGKGENPGERLAILTPFGQEDELAPEVEKQEEASGKTPEPQEQNAELQAREEEPPVSAPTPVPAPKAQEPAAHPFTRPDARSMAAWGANAQPVAAEKNQKAVSPAQAGPRFSYQLRIATFTRRDEAETLGRKIAGKGVNCQIVQHGKLFVLGCALRGTSQDYAAFTERLTKLRVKDPVLVAKKELKTR